MINEIYINSIAKLESRSLYRDRLFFKDEWSKRYVDLWIVFWQWLLDNNSEYSNNDIFSINTEDITNIELEQATTLFSNNREHILSPLELVFVSTIFNSRINSFNLAHKERKLSLSEWLSYFLNKFDSGEIEVWILQDFLNNKQDKISSFLINTFDKILPSNKCICIFEFFWPSELMQILLLGKYAKSLWHTVILSAAKWNEQTDFTRWIDAFINNTFIFDYIDYFIPYQDYEKSLRILKKYLLKPNNIKEGDLENIVYKKNDWNLIYIKPKEISEEELYDNFIWYYYRDDFYLNNWKKTVFLRLTPYKCYWSWCYFCTINSSHLYKYNNNKSKAYIYKLLDFVEKNNIDSVIFGDEAIFPEDIILLSNEIIKRKLKFIYRLRTRFDRKYTNEICKLFYKSWMRFCGIWLECYSDRINEMINKWNIWIKEKQKIIDAFNLAWIPFHNYSIIWFPNETAEEMYQTYIFLKNNIEYNNNYTCTPNTFWLNYWSYIGNHPNLFWIKIVNNKLELSNSLKLRIDYKKDLKLILLRKRFLKDIHAKQFLSFYKINKFKIVDPELFWAFIDRSGIFYRIKLFSNESIFRKTGKYLESLSNKKYESLINNKYILFKYIKIYPTQKEYNEWFNYWSWESVFLPKNFTKEDYISYDNTKTLKENIIANIAWSSLNENEIMGLIKWLFLTI